MNTLPGCRVVRPPAPSSALNDFVTGSRTFGSSLCRRLVSDGAGTRAHAEALRGASPPCWRRWGCVCHDKTLITHIDEGLDFLGWRIQRRRKRGTSNSYVYVHPSTKAVLAVKRKIKTLRRTVEPNQPLDDLLRPSELDAGGLGRLFPGRGVLGDLLLPEPLHVAAVWRWLRRKHRKSTWKDLRRRYCGGGWWPATEERV